MGDLGQGQEAVALGHWWHCPLKQPGLTGSPKGQLGQHHSRGVLACGTGLMQNDA